MSNITSIVEGFKRLGVEEARTILEQLKGILDARLVKEMPCGTTLRLCQLIKDFISPEHNVHHKSGTWFYVPIGYNKAHFLQSPASPECPDLDDDRYYLCSGLSGVFLIKGEYFELA